MIFTIWAKKNREMLGENNFSPIICGTRHCIFMNLIVTGFFVSFSSFLFNLFSHLIYREGYWLATIWMSFSNWWATMTFQDVLNKKSAMMQTYKSIVFWGDSLCTAHSITAHLWQPVSKFGSLRNELNDPWFLSCYHAPWTSC